MIFISGQIPVLDSFPEGWLSMCMQAVPHFELYLPTPIPELRRIQPEEKLKLKSS